MTTENKISDLTVKHFPEVVDKLINKIIVYRVRYYY